MKLSIKVDDLSRVAVGTTLQVLSVNRQTGECQVQDDSGEFFTPYCMHEPPSLCKVCSK